MKPDAEPDPTCEPQKSAPSNSDHTPNELNSGFMLTEFNSRDDSGLEDDSSLEDTEWELEDTDTMSEEQSLASRSLPDESEDSSANELPIFSGGFSGRNSTPCMNVQFSDYLNRVEYFPLPVYPAGMPREEPVSMFGEMVSNAPVLFDSANPIMEDADLPRPIAPFDYNPGNRLPLTPYTIIPPGEMYQNRPPLPLQEPQVSARAQSNAQHEDGQHPLELCQVPAFQGSGQAPLFQGRGFQMPPSEPQPTNAEHYQEDYFRAQQEMEITRNQELYKGGHLYLRPRSPLPDFGVEPPLLDSNPPPFKEHVFPATRVLCREEKAEADHDQPSTPKPTKQQPVYGTPDHGTRNFPQTYPPKQAKAHREDKRRRKSDFVFNKDADFDIEKSVSHLTSVLKDIAEDVKLNPTTTMSKPFSSKSVEEIGPFHYALRDSTLAARRRSDPMNLDSVRWERKMRASSMNKCSSPDAKRNDTPLLGEDDSSSGQDSPTPKSKKARVDLRTSSKQAPATICSTSENSPVTDRTASKKTKRMDPSADRARLQTPPIKKTKTRQPLPHSWDEASASDILMFELRKQGAEFPVITEVLRTTCGLHYLSRTLRNRHWKIETRIGEMPDNLHLTKTSEKKDSIIDKKKDDATDEEKDDVPEAADEETSGLSSPKVEHEEDTLVLLVRG